MRSLKFQYYYEIRFSSPVTHHNFTLKCLPQAGAMQRIYDLHADIYPNNYLSYSVDAFGNDLIYGRTDQPHDRFLMNISGIALTGTAESTPAPPLYQVGIFRRQTDLTKPGPALTALSSELGDGLRCGFPSLSYTKKLMDRIYDEMHYVPGSTTGETTAEEAFSSRSGVCQDYAHILLSLLREKNIPARYVAGMLLGEGASHAWIEVYSAGAWYPMDPTNRTAVTDSHIKISCGRDASDCLVNRGVFNGNATQTTYLQVSVRPMEGG